MCGIGYIKNRDVFNSWLRKHKITNHYNYNVRELKYPKKDDYWLEVYIDGNTNRVEFEAEGTELYIDYDPQYSDVFTMDVANHEGDSEFWNDDTLEMDYDIDLDYFTNEEQQIYKEMSDENVSGLCGVVKTFGATRIG
jgi:hypothetical protein